MVAPLAIGHHARAQQACGVILSAARKAAITTAVIGVPHLHQRAAQRLAIGAEHTALDGESLLAAGAAGAQLALPWRVAGVKRPQLIARRGTALLSAHRRHTQHEARQQKLAACGHLEDRDVWKESRHAQRARQREFACGTGNAGLVAYTRDPALAGSRET